MKWNYNNPVHIFGGSFYDALESLGENLIPPKIPYALLVYDKKSAQKTIEQICSEIGREPVGILDGVDSNPGLENMRRLCEEFSALRPAPQILIALGGGSVMDACKGLCAGAGSYDAFRDQLTTGKSGEKTLPYIAIPTTAGTGSEVTCWATFWDYENGKKHSLSHSSLYAKAALLCPELTLGLPAKTTLSTGLDAFSHSLESLWNINANPISRAHAEFAAQSIFKTLPKLLKKMAKGEEDLSLRTTMQKNALIAGLAFSNTKTAIAHNISYDVTMRQGTPHGIACSFTLPMIIRAIHPQDQELTASIQRIFWTKNAQDASDILKRWFIGLGVAMHPRDYGYDKDQWIDLLRSASSGQRGRNYSQDINHLISLYEEILG